jgi:DNA replication protein DnaC
MPGLRATYEAIAREAADQAHSYPAFLSTCLAQEIESRRCHRLASRLRTARFPATKTLDTFDFACIPKLSKPKVMLLAQGYQNVLLSIGHHEKTRVDGQLDISENLHQELTRCL